MKKLTKRVQLHNMLQREIDQLTTERQCNSVKVLQLDARIEGLRLAQDRLEQVERKLP